MAAYTDQRIAERLAMDSGEWPNDALTRFLTTEVDGERLSPRAIATQMMFAFGAGSDTTRNTLGSLLYQLAKSPELYQRLRNDRSLVDHAIDEALRHDTPAQYLVRECLSPDVELGGQPVAQGDWVMLSIGAANRDESVFDQPEEFNPDRANLKDHVAFGAGPHICPGSALARLELRLAVNCWCDAVASFELDPGYTWEPRGTGMLHGPEHLSLLVTPVN
jgi:cytochrome P450